MTDSLTSSSRRPEPLAADALLAAIVESADDGILSKNLDGIVTSWNPAAESIFGYSAAEMVGESIMKLLPPDRHAEEVEILQRIGRGEKIAGHETTRVRKDGTTVALSITLSPVRDEAGGIIGASNIVRDLAPQRRAAEVAALLSAIVDSSDDAIISKNLNSIITSWNRGAERVFGYTAEEMIGQPVWKLFPPDRWDEEPRILERIKRGEYVDHFETKRVRKGGTLIDVSVTISPIFGPGRTIIGASKIARDISDRKLAHDRLVAAHQQLQRADQLKSEFLATLSHELRTPLNAILGWTQVLTEAGCNDPAEVAEGLAVIERNARSQAQMVEDLLDVSRIASGKVTLELQQLDLASVVDSAMQSLLPAAQAKEIRLTSHFSGVEGLVRGDRTRLQQVVWNLLSNAIKFTPKRGRVQVSITRQESQVDVAVADNGPGIDPDFLPHVFERFRQADGSTTRRFGGLGLGLSIVKQLVEMHGGEVRAASEGEGKGATFTVSLPIVASRPEVLFHAPPPGDRSGARDETVLQGVRVLAVDDDPDAGRLVERILRSRGAEVVTVTSAAAGLDALKQAIPDVLVSDIGMPNQDGYAFIREVRRRPEGIAIPAIALTALARTEDRTRALNAGFQTHVAKPVEPRELVAVVASLASLRSGWR